MKKLDFKKVVPGFLGSLLAFLSLRLCTAIAGTAILSVTGLLKVFLVHLPAVVLIGLSAHTILLKAGRRSESSDAFALGLIASLLGGFTASLASGYIFYRFANESNFNLVAANWISASLFLIFSILVCLLLARFFPSTEDQNGAQKVTD